MLVENTVTGDVKFIIRFKLDQKCVTNLFAVIRRKSENRDNPDPLKFRVALRKVMADKVLLTGTGTNSKDDFDNSMLNFASSKQR